MYNLFIMEKYLKSTDKYSKIPVQKTLVHTTQ